MAKEYDQAVYQAVCLKVGHRMGTLITNVEMNPTGGPIGIFPACEHLCLSCSMSLADTRKQKNVPAKPEGGSQ